MRSDDYGSSARSGSANSAISLPPFRQLSTSAVVPLERRNDSLFGVQSMLNPRAEVADQQRGRMTAASQLDLLSAPAAYHHPLPLPSINRPTGVESPSDEHGYPVLYPPPSRLAPAGHMPSPASSEARKSQSLSLPRPPPASVNPQPSPYLHGENGAMDAVALQPALAQPPIAARPAHLVRATARQSRMPSHVGQTTARQSRMASHTGQSAGLGQTTAVGMPAHHASYHQPASVMASAHDNKSYARHYAPAPGAGHEQKNGYEGTSGDMERNTMIPMAPSSQASVQLMTIQSQHGRPVQIPVDVQAASKVADEKRRRNAGASARFRARRKEKEREASVSISRLEQQLREAFEDVEFYRAERNHYRSIVTLHPDLDRHGARPLSPRLRRPSATFSQAPSSTGSARSDGDYADYDDEIREESRNVRRRTSIYPADSAPAPFPFPTPPTLPPVQNVSYGQPSGPHSDRPMYRDPFASSHERFDGTG